MNINKMMKQAQKMQEQMMEMQEKLKEIITEVSVGGDMVKLKMNGQYVLEDIEINEEIIKSEEKEMLQDLIISAVNEAKSRVDERNKEEMAKITGGVNIPGF